MGYSVCVYKGVPLKVSVDMMGMAFTITAISFRENARVDQAKLTLPADINISDAEYAAQDIDPEQMKQAMTAMQEMNKALQNSPELQEAMELQRTQQFKTVQEQKIEQAYPEEVFEEVQDQAGKALKDSMDDATRSGVKKAFGSALKSLF
jgi:hypothetical protein